MTAATTVNPGGGDFFDFGGLGIHWRIDGDRSEGRFAVVHHPIAPHALAAPLHYHHNFENYFREVAAAWGDIERFK